MKEQAIAVFNAGSSSLKFALFSHGGAVLQRLWQGQVAAIGGEGRFTLHASDGAVVVDEITVVPDHGAALQRLLGWLDEHGGLTLFAVGHRVVHGGAEFSAPVLVDDDLLRRLWALAPLAPLHQPHNLKAIELLRDLRPGLPQVACFDTAFHRTMPEAAQRYALPRELFERGVRGYGFHGLSYEHVAAVLPGHLGAAANGRVIVAHLGNGASICALREARSVATTMGFTPLDGLPMGTRCGAIDPGVLLYLQRQGMSVDELDDLLNHRSGLLGLSGISSDMRTLLASDDPHAESAIEQFCYRAAREIGSLVVALAGLDAIVFTGGIGEHAAPVRERICQQLRWLGVELEQKANLDNRICISAPGSSVSVWIVAADEEQIIAHHCHTLVIGT